MKVKTDIKAGQTTVNVNAMNDVKVNTGSSVTVTLPPEPPTAPV
jgi:hypothetical protein